MHLSKAKLEKAARALCEAACHPDARLKHGCNHCVVDEGCTHWPEFIEEVKAVVRALGL